MMFVSPRSAALQSSSPFLPFTFNQNLRRSPSQILFKFLSLRCCLSSAAIVGENGSPRNNYAGVRLEETVDNVSGRLRLDSWISSRISGISRARVQSSIKTGLVIVNGRVVDKTAYNVKAGDEIHCTISDLQPLRAQPENIPLDIIYEDEHVLVVNKPADMVVHPAPGNPTGTLVNGILHHCSLPGLASSSDEVIADPDDVSDDEDLVSSSYAAAVRPGIVHRLDKGTSGLLVVAKDEHSHAHLSKQFKLRTIRRVYLSLTSGVPSPVAGRIDIPIGRDIHNRLRMTAVTGPVTRGKARNAASRYKVIETLASGGSALVEWKLETGRTHQIRAHAKYIGCPLLGDEVYGGTKNMALSLLQPRVARSYQNELLELLSGLDRPCLHAISLGFEHPFTRKQVHFSCPPPPDFDNLLRQLSKMTREKVCYLQLPKAAVAVSVFLHSCACDIVSVGHSGLCYHVQLQVCHLLY
ncbi:RNA pseudouridine synthase 2, chloroplastic [Linum perenne]